MKLFIHPMYTPEDRLVGYTVTLSRGRPLVDEQILEHFPVEASGVEMREAMQSQYPEATVEWSGALCTEGNEQCCGSS